MLIYNIQIKVSSLPTLFLGSFVDFRSRLVLGVDWWKLKAIQEFEIISRILCLNIFHGSLGKYMFKKLQVLQAVKKGKKSNLAI